MQTKYCPSCGQDVRLESSLEGNYLLIGCAICGLGLGVKAASAEEVRRFKEAHSPDPVASAEAMLSSGEHARLPPAGLPGGMGSGEHKVLSTGEFAAARFTSGEHRALRAQPTPEAVRKLRRVVIVEDSSFLREVTRDLLLSKGIARDVVDCEDGLVFLETFTKWARAGEKPDLIVLDVRMPGMDGREAAYALRAIEKVLGVKRTPVLFFSGILCDADFKTALQDIGNARYIKKAEGGDAQQLGERIVAVLSRLVGTKK